MGFCWSPSDAMKAYMHTLQLCKDTSNQKRPCGSSKLIEPECMEFISALAAGNQAQLMLDVSSAALSSSTLALAVAAKHTNGRLVCVRRTREAAEEAEAQLKRFDLSDAVEFELGDPCEVIKKHKNIDFAVVDQNVIKQYCPKLFVDMVMNPSRSVVVVYNQLAGNSCCSYSRAMKGRVGIKSMTLPIGGGMEVTRIGTSSKGTKRGLGRRRRTFVVYED